VLLCSSRRCCSPRLCLAASADQSSFQPAARGAHLLTSKCHASTLIRLAYLATCTHLSPQVQMHQAAFIDERLPHDLALLSQHNMVARLLLVTTGYYPKYMHHVASIDDLTEVMQSPLDTTRSPRLLIPCSRLKAIS